MKTCAPRSCLRRSLRNSTYFLLTCSAAVAAGCAASGGGNPEPDDPADVALAREIEEADIFKLVDGYFYLSNAYTGLRIIDARDVTAPAFLGRVPLAGRGVELYVIDDHALVFTAADFGYCAGEAVGFDDDLYDSVGRPNYTGSRLTVIDVADKAEPFTRLTMNFDGFITGTRRVGDIVYVAGNIARSVFVISLDVSDPANVEIVENKRFTGAAQDIYVTAETVYALGNDPSLADTTLVTCIDIANTNGLITPRDAFRVPGEVQSRFFADEYEDTFRIVTEAFDFDNFTTVVALYVYDVSNLDDVKRIARLPLVTNESLRAVRFDGDRGYAVTFRVVDPLFVLDLSDPDEPVISGELEVPGFSTHLVPLGDRLVGVGFDTGDWLEPAVSLYDVSNPANPRQLARVVLESFRAFDTTSEATVDEKALGVLPDAGLILLPYARYDRELGEYIDGLQLIELESDTLRERGRIEHRGLVRRSGVEQDHLWILSDLAFQVVDADDLQAPESVAQLDIITDQELLDAGLSVCAESARYTGRDLFWSGGWGFWGCGALSPVMFPVLLAGFIALRKRR